ncbi:MAG: hypothetical protein WCF12_01375 [Propionicimonas sp.]
MTERPVTVRVSSGFGLRADHVNYVRRRMPLRRTGIKVGPAGVATAWGLVVRGAACRAGSLLSSCRRRIRIQIWKSW